MSAEHSLRRAGRSRRLGPWPGVAHSSISGPEIIRLAVMGYVRFPLSFRNAGDRLHESGIDVSHESVRSRWNRFGPMFASEIRRRRVQQLRAFSRWQRRVIQGRTDFGQVDPKSL